jgi:hypothetical protein
MRTRIKIGVFSVAVLVAIGVAASDSLKSGEPKGSGKSEHKLVGTWKRTFAKYDGKEVKLPDGMTHLKHVTPTQFMWAIYDEDGKVQAALGGTISIKEKEKVYEEVPEYGIGAALDQLKGKTQTFRWKVEGNKWYHEGKLSSGLAIEEVWQRVENK